MIPDLTAAEVKRFHGKITRDDGCWPWSGETNNNGYGRFAIYRDGKRIRILAHRLAYALEYGIEPVGVLRHRCDNPPCCKPADLISGTQADNVHDAMDRGRLVTTGLDKYRAVRDAAVYVLLEQGLKRCYDCKEDRPVTEFYRNRTGVGGLAQICKYHASERQREGRRGGLSERERRRLNRRPI